MNDTPDGDTPQNVTASLLPYEQWLEGAYREVMFQALTFAATNGLPGEHHFYMSFRTDFAGVEIPAALRAQYPQEMTIVLQHQFWDLAVDRSAKHVTVGLSFNGVGSMLVIPFGAITGFSDPAVGITLGFRPSQAASWSDAQDGSQTDGDAVSDKTLPSTPSADTAHEGQVVKLDAFRKRANTPPTN